MAGRRSYGTAGAAFADAASQVYGFKLASQEKERQAYSHYLSRIAEAGIHSGQLTPQQGISLTQTGRLPQPMSGGLTGQEQLQGLAGMDVEGIRAKGGEVTYDYKQGNHTVRVRLPSTKPKVSSEPTAPQLIGAEGTLGKVAAARTGGFLGIGGHPTVDPAEIEALRGLLGQAVRRAASKQGTPPLDPTIQALKQQGYTIESIDQ